MLYPARSHAAETYDGEVYYFGDLHVHTGASADGGSSDLGVCPGGATCGAAADIVDTAKTAGLDFFAVTDHINGPSVGDSTDFSTVFQAVVSGNDPGNFVTIPGAELFFTLPDGRELGHKNLLLFGDNATLSSFTQADGQHGGGLGTTVDDCAAIDTYMQGITASWGDALLLPHHPAAGQPMPTDWSCHNPTWEPAVEIYSSHGNSRDAVETYDLLGRSPSEGGMVDAALDPAGYGLVMGFIGGTDSHDTKPGTVCDRDEVKSFQLSYSGGLTGVSLPEGEALTRAALHQAIQDRRTYASSGVMIPVALQVLVDGAVAGDMGDALALSPGQSLSLSVGVPAAYQDQVQAVYLVTPSEEISVAEGADLRWTWSSSAESAPEWAYFILVIDGDTYYGAAGCFDGGDTAEERIWLSPSWFNLTVSDTGGADTGAADTGAADTGAADTGAADTSPPQITGVELIHRGRRTLFRFSTDEPATSEVCTDTGACTSATLGTKHSVLVNTFQASSYTISATDEAGNSAEIGPYTF